MTAPGEASVVSEKIRHGYIDDLVHWRVPWASGCVLALGLLFFVLTDIFGYAYTALLCMMALVHLLVSAMYSFVQQWNGASVDDWTARFKIDGDEASRIGRRVALEYNAVVDWYCHLAAARDLKMLGMVIAVLFVMWILANVFSDSGLCLIVFALSFSGPVMYEKNKAIIDNTAMTHKQKIMAMIPRATMTKYDKHDEQRPKED